MIYWCINMYFLFRWNFGWWNAEMTLWCIDVFICILVEKLAMYWWEVVLDGTLDDGMPRRHFPKWGSMWQSENYGKFVFTLSGTVYLFCICFIHASFQLHEYLINSIHCLPISNPSWTSIGSRAVPHLHV